MLIKEYFRKFLLYFSSNDPYFELSRSDIDDYDVEYEKFIDESALYNNLDINSIPMKKDNNENYYFISLIISYAIAHLQRYLRKDNQDSLNRVLSSVKFLVSNSFQTETSALLKAYNKQTKAFDGQSSGMDNGMALSLISRVYLITKDEKLLEFCEKLANAYYITIEEGGFTRIISNDNMWFDEFPLSNYRVLNGKLFALLGLIDYRNIIKNEIYNDLISKGTFGLLEMLDSFDRNWWSNYFVGSFNYISSAKYHSLHILQLEIIGSHLQSFKILNYSKKFGDYNTDFNRILSGFVLLYDKLKMKVLK